MRISSIQIFNIANNSMADANEAIVKTQEQISTGKRVITPSDDPVAATKILQISDELASITQYKKNIDIAQNNLASEESILGSVSSLLQRMQELSVQAGNTATLSTNEYRALANEVDSRLSELQALLNTQNTNGDYIFGGYKSQGEPFTGDSLSGFQYNGDEGQQHIKIANNSSVESNDSGKTLFVDVQSTANTIKTYTSNINKSDPPLQISVGRIIDQTEYDDFYPEDIIISFNADTNISPAGKNFTATEKSTGRVIADNQPYSPGMEVEMKGLNVRLFGDPVSGVAATPATRIFGADSAAGFPLDFTAPAEETFTITVAGQKETFVLDANVSSTVDLSNILNSAVNGNAAALTNLGLTVDNTGIRMPDGVSFSIAGGSANIDSVLGLNATLGSVSTDGVLAQAGDRAFVESSKKQDVLTTLARFSEAMKAYDGTDETRGALEDEIAATLGNLGHAQTSVLDVVAKLGARQNTLESTLNLHLDTELAAKDVLSDLQDVDYAEAATRLSAQSLVLQAAQSSFVRVSRLTLFSQL